MPYRTPGLGPERRAFTTNAELGQWLDRLAQAPADASARAFAMTYGQSQRGEPLRALLLTRQPSADPAALEASGKPVIALIGQLRGDEPAPAEALLALASELREGLLQPLLERVHVLIVPRADPDGSPGQGGPDGDALALQTPEGRSLSKLLVDYRPGVVAELREYDAIAPYMAAFQAAARADVLTRFSATPNYPEFLGKAAREWFQGPLQQALQAGGLRADLHHRVISTGNAPLLSMGDAHLTSWIDVQGLRNSVGVLVASRKATTPREHLQRRVHAHVLAASSLLRTAAERGTSLEQVRAFVARDTGAQACKGPAILSATPAPARRDLAVIDPGTGRERMVGAAWQLTTEWQAPVARPRPCGYLLPAEASAAVEQLRALGIPVLRVTEMGSVLSDLSQGPGSAPQRRAIDVPAGSHYVALNQASALLAIAVLDPDSPQSLAGRGVVASDAVARVLTPPALVFDERP